jgi:hypothetical protein
MTDGESVQRAGSSPGVEALSDARWARIEESLMERLDEELPAPKGVAAPTRARAGRRVLALALVAATFAVSAAAAVVLRVGSPPVHASSLRVVTEASASHVTLGETSLEVSPESGIEVREEEHATVLTLERGEVSLQVAPREKDRPFLVEAGDVEVRVVGTAFSVRRLGVGAAVSVRRGVVEVREHGELATLHAGDHWPDEAKSDVPNTALPTVASPVPAAVTPQLPATPPTAATPLAAASAPLPRRATTRTKPVAEPVPAMATTSAASTPASAPAPASAPVPPADDAPPAAAPAEPTAQSRYETAARLERTDAVRALLLYTDLAQGSDAWAQDSLYAAGRLQADRGARTDAARLLEEYLRRFPRGSNAQDARALRESLR